MLHTETVSPSTLELLKSLMSDQILKDFCLVGGTAASLMLGHRISVDLDFFTTEPFDIEILKSHLSKNYGFKPSILAKNTVKGKIAGVKIDCITHRFPWISPTVEVDNIRVAGLPDIAAMKLNAIVNSGERIKDFIDIAYLSQKMPLNDMLKAYENKYDTPSLIAARAISYWDDINFEEPILMKYGKLDWEEIAECLRWIIQNPNKIRLPQMP